MQSAQRALDQAPSAEALSLAGRAATKAGRKDEALAYLERLSDESDRAVVEGIGERGELLLHLGRLSEAEKQFLRVLRKDPSPILRINAWRISTAWQAVIGTPCRNCCSW